MTLQEQLDDAKAQYHLLVTGQAAKVYVDQNGERIEYQSANRAALAAYIAGLEQRIGSASVTLGPMRVLM